MASLPTKQALVERLKDDVASANIVVIADYRGLTDRELGDLRGLLRAENIKLKVAKNTLVKRAVAGTDMDALSPYLKGPTALVLGYGDQVAAVKVVREYLKKGKKKNELRAGFLQGEALSAAGVEELASMPPLEELRGKLVMCIASPLTGMVNVLNAPATKLARVLDGYGKTKEDVA